MEEDRGPGASEIMEGGENTPALGCNEQNTHLKGSKTNKGIYLFHLISLEVVLGFFIKDPDFYIF